MQVPYITLIVILKIISGLPLVVYPVMLLANIMSIAGFQQKDKQHKITFRQIAFRFFIYYNTAYPITYALCYWMCSSFTQQGDYAWAIGIISLPAIILAVLFKYSTK